MPTQHISANPQTSLWLNRGYGFCTLRALLCDRTPHDLMLAHAAGRSWPARCGVEPGRQEPTATLSAATLALQMISMLQAYCWPTWPSSPSVNLAALTAHLYRGQPYPVVHADPLMLACLCWYLDRN